jgi:preprotein translocase subunit SecB
VDAKIYNALTGRATLRGIWMTESRFEMSPQALDVDDGSLNHIVKPSKVEVTVEENGVITGFIRFEAISRRKRRRVVYVSARYFVSYRVEGGCDQDMAELFMDRVGKLAAYPYFRALVASLVAQAGAQVPTLPILSFQPRNIQYAGN